MDPLFRKYPYLTPYQFSSNQPIHAQELEGLESEAEIKPTAAANLTVNMIVKESLDLRQELILD